MASFVKEVNYTHYIVPLGSKRKRRNKVEMTLKFVLKEM
jgi:hypothetical protein